MKTRRTNQPRRSHTLSTNRPLFGSTHRSPLTSTVSPSRTNLIDLRNTESIVKRMI